jgi:hypothetical protein
MVMTILEAFVDRGNWQALRNSYSLEINQLDPGIIHTYLVQAKNDESIWRIITIWENQEASGQNAPGGRNPARGNNVP